MRSGDLAGLLVATAGVLAALAAIPSTSYRTLVLVASTSLVLLALLIAVLSRQQVKTSFKIVTPQPGEGVNGGVVVSGTVPRLRSGTLFVFEEGFIAGQRVWLFGGEALVDGINWSFDYESKTGLAERPRRTLSIVRASRNCKKRFRSIRPDSNGQLIVYDPPPDGCEILGQVSVFLSAQP